MNSGGQTLPTGPNEEKRGMIRQTIFSIVLAATTLVAGGCLVSKGSSMSEEGVKVSQPTLAQVEIGKTTESWLVATVGEPTSRRKVDEHVQVLRYDYKQRKNSGGYVFLIYAGGEREEKTSSAIFEVTDGVITRYWTED